MRRALATLAATLALAGCAAGPDRSDAPAAPGEAAVVERVVDGDTIIVRMDGERVRVRLIGIDTPETVHPERPVECFGPEASRRAAELMPAGTSVRLEGDPLRDRLDRFGRLLAYVHVDGREPVNLTLLREGHAEVLVVGERGFVRLDAFAAAERDARRAGRGLWGACPGAAARPPAALGGGCPAERPIKGNLPAGLYHRPGDPGHEATRAERCFATEEEARLEGFRLPRGVAP